MLGKNYLKHINLRKKYNFKNNKIFKERYFSSSRGIVLVMEWKKALK